MSHGARCLVLGLLGLVCGLGGPVARAASGTGGVESPFSLGLSARDLGLGGAVGAWPGDAGAAMANPALLATLQRQEVDLFHTSLFMDTLYDAGAFTYPTGLGALQGAFLRLATSDVPRTTTSVHSEGTFSVQQIQGRLAFGTPLWRSFSIGAAVKYFRQSVPPFSDSGFGADVGLLFRPSPKGRNRSRLSVRNLSVGLSVAELLQPEVRLRSDVSRPARVVRGSLGYRFVSPGESSALSLGLEVQRVTGVQRAHAGLEYGFRRLLFLRGGYDGEDPCLGAGLQYKGLQFDWALAKSDLGSSHRFSLAYRFGPVRDARGSQRLTALKWIARTYTGMKQFPEALKAWENVREEFPDDAEVEKGLSDTLHKRDKEVAEILDQVKKLLAQGQTAQAIPGLTRVLSMDPENARAKALMREADEKVFLSQNYMQGLEAYNRGDYRGAVEAFGVVYRRAPKYRDVARLWSDAKSHYEPLVNMPEELSRLYGKGISEFLKGNYPKAIEIWRKVLEKSPDHFIVQRNIAEAQARLKESRPAAKEPQP